MIWFLIGVAIGVVLLYIKARNRRKAAGQSTNFGDVMDQMNTDVQDRKTAKARAKADRARLRWERRHPGRVVRGEQIAKQAQDGK
jgi:hypothetical protein